MDQLPWWQTAVIYQVYPRSFQDSDGDGVGDICGIIQRLPYFVELGIDALWLSPIFPSPMADFGYDISDYCGVDPLFGKLEDLDRLIVEAHALGIKLILDLVPNHTSIEHTWFVESRASTANPKRDWYIWKDAGPDGGLPNNWLSVFGGTGWEHDGRTGQFYYHTFLAAQPDLNWRNPEVRSAVYDVMRFSFLRGIDGFRVDAVWYAIMDKEFRDNPVNPGFGPTSTPDQFFLPIYTADRPEMEEVIAEMRQVSDEFSDRLLIGELYLPIERLVAYYGRDLTGVHLPFNFALLTASWETLALAELIREYYAALPPGGWPNWVLGNHDRPRVASRIGPEQARVAAMLLLTLHGTPTIYCGEEIGMEQAKIPQDRVRDPLELNVPGFGLGRDGCRTPMQWDSSEHAGFSTAEPWLPIGADFKDRNVDLQKAQGDSMFSLYCSLINLRSRCRPLTRGSLHSVRIELGVLIFVREYQDERITIALNVTAAPQTLTLDLGQSQARILLSTLLERAGATAGHVFEIAANEGVMIGW